MRTKKQYDIYLIIGGTYHFIFMCFLYSPGGLDLGLCGLMGFVLCFIVFFYIVFFLLAASFDVISHTRNLLTSTGAGDMTIYLLHSFDYDS